jgi:hypothetical protein
MEKIIDKWKEYYVGYTPMRIGNDQWKFKFDNNYGASIVRGPYTYGGGEGLFEMACIKYERNSDDYDLYYDDGMWTDVRGYLTIEDIDELLEFIKNM